MPTDPERRRLVVVGAGLAGLTAAHQLRDLDPLVLEAEPWIGGRCRHVANGGLRDTLGAEGWYDLDLDAPERRLVESLGVGLAPVAGDTALGLGGRLLFGSELADLVGATGLAGTPAEADLATTRRRVAEAGRALAGPDPEAKVVGPLLEVSAIEWLGAVDPAVEDLYRRLFATEFAADLDRLPALFLITCMPPHGGESGASWGEFLAPPGGCPDIVEALAAGLPSPPRTSAAVTAISAEEHGCRVDFVSGDERHSVQADRVIVATPPGAAAKVIADLPEAKRRALDSLVAHPIIEAGIVVGPGPAPWQDFAAAWITDLSFSMCLPSQTDRGREDRRSVVHLLAIGPTAAALWECDDEEVHARFGADLEGLFPGVADRVESRVLGRWREGVVMPRLGYEQEVDSLLAPLGPIHFAGDYLGFAAERGPGGVGLHGRAGEFAVTVCVHAAVRSGLRVAGELSPAMQP
jgi:phytoene dehydrogenase-like protein